MLRLEHIMRSKTMFEQVPVASREKFHQLVKEPQTVFESFEKWHVYGNDFKTLIASHRKWKDSGFANTVFNDSTFINCSFADCDLHNSDFQRVDFQSTSFMDTDFTGADLSGANFTNAIWARVNLEGANLFGVNLQSCSINAVNWWGAKGIRVISGVGKNRRIIYGVAHPNGKLMIQAGCFWGTAAEIRKRIRDDYAFQPDERKDHLDCIRLLGAWRKSQPLDKPSMGIPF